MSFLKNKAQGKTAGEIVKENLTPEGIYECVVSYLKFDEDRGTLLVGADTLNEKKDGKPIRLFSRYELDVASDAEDFEEIKKCENFFDAMKINSAMVNFFTLLFEVGCLKNEDGGVYFSPPGFFGRKISMRVSHSQSEDGRTFANSNIVLNRRSIKAEPLPVIPGYVAPEGFSETSNAIVKTYAALRNGGILTHLCKLREDIGFKSVESGLYLLTIKSFSEKNGSINIGVAAARQGEETDGPTNVSLRFRQTDLQEMQKVEQIYNLASEDRKIEEEKDFVGFQFYAELTKFEWKGNFYNSVESIVGNSQTNLSLDLNDSDPFADALNS